MLLKDYYFNHYRQIISTLAPSTRTGYESSAELYVIPHFGDWELEDIRVRHINLWVAQIPQPGAAEKAYKTLRQIIRQSMDDEVYSEEVSDPTRRRIRLPKKAYYRPETLDAHQLKVLLQTCWGWEYEATLLCAVGLGVRRGESCALRWKDINLKSGVVSIEWSLQYVGGEVVEVPTKTHRSHRPHVLPRFAIDRLREIKRELRPHPSDRLLGSDANPERYARHLKAYCKKMCVDHVPPRNLRHSFSSVHYQTGTNDKTIQDMLGHEQFSTSADNYIVLDEDVYRAAQRRYDKALRKA